MEPDLIRDGFNFEETAEYLDIPKWKVQLAVIDQKLRCGVFAKWWQGNYLPILPGIKETEWDVIRGRSDGDGLSILLLREKTTDLRIVVKKAYAEHFWYLDELLAADLFNNPDEAKEPSHLKPFDGTALHKKNPLQFLSEEFVFLLDRRRDFKADKYIPYLITIADVIFLRQDLDDFREKHINNPNEKDPGFIQQQADYGSQGGAESTKSAKERNKQWVEECLSLIASKTAHSARQAAHRIAAKYPKEGINPNTLRRNEDLKKGIEALRQKSGSD